jgi:hypothetical protein
MNEISNDNFYQERGLEPPALSEAVEQRKKRKHDHRSKIIDGDGNAQKHDYGNEAEMEDDGFLSWVRAGAGAGAGAGGGGGAGGAGAEEDDDDDDDEDLLKGLPNSRRRYR